ncbi:hypothetical protein RhiirA1_482307 [Rhizophagus irregularis]|nr:hypothetical protein RhiirA1_482307 [Rhizophagus irregularis]
MPIEIVRSKGFIWSARHNDIAILFSQAGSSVNISPISYWVASLPKEEQLQIFYENPEVRDNWDPEFGDRKTELVIIGIDLPKEEIIKELDACLLTDEEFNEDWHTFETPFDWNLN